MQRIPGKVLQPEQGSAGSGSAFVLGDRPVITIADGHSKSMDGDVASSPAFSKLW